MHDFVLASIGGSMIGLAAVLLMATHGKILGVSGIVSGLLPPLVKDWSWRAAFVAGVLIAPLAYTAVSGQTLEIVVTEHWLVLCVGGFLVGFGTVTGSGCTSGHGVCGLPRLSTRSLVATVTFVFVAALTVLISQTVLGH